MFINTYDNVLFLEAKKGKLWTYAFFAKKRKKFIGKYWYFKKVFSVHKKLMKIREQPNKFWDHYCKNCSLEEKGSENILDNAINFICLMKFKKLARRYWRDHIDYVKLKQMEKELKMAQRKISKFTRCYEYFRDPVFQEHLKLQEDLEIIICYVNCWVRRGKSPKIRMK